MVNSLLLLVTGTVRMHGERPHIGWQDHHCDLQRRSQTWHEEAHNWGRFAALQVPRQEGGHDFRVYSQVSGQFR